MRINTRNSFVILLLMFALLAPGTPYPKESDPSKPSGSVAAVFCRWPQIEVRGKCVCRTEFECGNDYFWDEETRRIYFSR
ncbi:CLUMA_CG003489, isoform A [Clunio marinus]|uniref:CLUMA_CG003489, isoform A n=1 Tax=Clunio marinus TaxID=568069 RepID=A0A1J1HNP2_9DIPT|nr:CLUMA_CG003489, isoform A [Clunio marinus]